MSMSRDQLQQLGIAATAAVKHQRMIGEICAEKLPPDLRTASKSDQNEFWRHQQVAQVTQRVASFKDLADLRPQGGPDEYSLMMQHFEALAGPFWKGRATKRTVRIVEDADCDRVPGCTYVREMANWMAKADFHFPNYFLPIIRRWRDASGAKIEDYRRLRTWQLKQLHDTVVNRARAKLGLGDADNRNKKARLGDSESPHLPVSTSPSLPAAPLKAREYVLRTRPAKHIPDPDNEPF